ncbi:MAG TPA: hypothetical protein PK398_00705 [Candidatus Gracilibacteria bacterium]|nr:hypothetical protein [Candidatus Gracilibacteria bacterium]
MSQASKLALIKEMLESAESSLRTAKQMISELVGPGDKNSYARKAEAIDTNDHEDDGEDKIVEGVFDGEKMQDKNEKTFPVPANYASKSKLVPGDVLKLTIKADGSFVYKQIGPVERKKVVGVLTYEDGQYKVIANAKAYKVLLASVTYHKAEIGDQVTLIIPEVEDSQYGAIEAVIPKDISDLDTEGEF